MSAKSAAESVDNKRMSEIAAISSLQQSQAQTEVAFAVARKALDNARAQGDAAISLLQSAAEIQQQTAQPQTQRPLGPEQTINIVA